MKKKPYFKGKYLMYVLIMALSISLAMPLTSWYMTAISAVMCFISTILIVALWEGVYGRLAELEIKIKSLENKE